MVRRIKKSLLQDPIVLATPLQTQFRERPFTQTILTPQKQTMDTVQKVSMALLTVPSAIGFIAALFTAQWVLLAITGVMLLLLGFIMWIMRLRAQMVWQVTWHDNVVEVADGRYGPTKHWLEPLDLYVGLQRDIGLRPRVNEYAAGRRYHGLLLAHPDPTKSILLHASRDPIDDASITYYATQLNQKLLTK